MGIALPDLCAHKHEIGAELMVLAEVHVLPIDE